MSLLPRVFRCWLVGGILLVGAGRLTARVFDVRDYGALGDGVALDSPAINATITAAAAAGGGTVYFPPGTYRSFTIRLRSHITLQLDHGATIEAARPSADLTEGYDAPEPNPGIDQYEDFGHSHWRNSLIWGEGLEDIAIVGPGRIWGRGLSRGGANRFDPLPGEGADGAPVDNALPAAAKAAIAAIEPGPFGYPGRDTLPAGVGNKSIALKHCRKVTFRDFTIEHGGHFAILATGVDNWTVDNLMIDTNRDGIDFDCCQNVRVVNTSVNSPRDDAICPKSSYGLGYARITENVTITNCYVSGFMEGTLVDGTRKRQSDRVVGHGPTGRIKCGTESNGGFRNITISNCVFEHCRGFALESVDGALMEDITVSNLTMREIFNAPIFVRLGARLRGPEGRAVGTAQRIKIDTVVVHDASAEAGILIVGIPGHTINDLALSNIFIDFAGGGTAADGDRVVPEQIAEYPEPSRFGKLPAWGLYARHVQNLAVDRVEFRSALPDLRPVAWLEDATGVTLDRVTLPRVEAQARLVLKAVRGLDISRSSGLAETSRPDLVGDERW